MVAPRKAPAKKATARKVAAKKAPEPPRSSSRVSPAVDSWLGTVELDEAGKVRAALARSLAAALDEAAGADSGAMAMATAGIAKELRAVVDAILEDTEDDGDFVADLFAAESS